MAFCLGDAGAAEDSTVADCEDAGDGGAAFGVRLGCQIADALGDRVVWHAKGSGKVDLGLEAHIQGDGVDVEVM